MIRTARRLRYVLKRLLQALPIVVANFFLLHMVEGDAVDVLACEAGSATRHHRG